MSYDYTCNYILCEAASMNNVFAKAATWQSCLSKMLMAVECTSCNHFPDHAPSASFYALVARMIMSNTLCPLHTRMHS